MKPDYYGVILIHVKVQTKIKVVFFKFKTIFLIDDKKVESLRNEMKPDYYGVILIHVKVQTKIKVGFSNPKQYF